MERIKERRKYSRLDKNRGFIFCRLLNKNTEEIKESIIDNISVKGLSFGTVEPIVPGVILECEIYQPIGNQKNIVVSIFILAKVVWIREIDNSDDSGNYNYRLGLRLLKKLDKAFEFGVNYIHTPRQGFDKDVESKSKLT